MRPPDLLRLAERLEHPEQSGDACDDAASALRWAAEVIADLAVPIVERYACQRCGRRDGLDAVVTDEEWTLIAEGRWNILCLWCMDQLALEKGLCTGVALYFAGRALYGVREHAVEAAIKIAARTAVRRERARRPV